MCAENTVRSRTNVVRSRTRGMSVESELRMMSALRIVPCLDSAQMAESRRQELDIPRDVAAALGRSAVTAARNGFYVTRDGGEVVWQDAVQTAGAAKRSIAPDTTLPLIERSAFTETQVQVTNETTLGASRRTDMPRSSWVHGVVALLRMTCVGLRRISVRRWKRSMAGRFRTSSLPSQIGRRRGSSLGLSVMCSPQIAAAEARSKRLTNYASSASSGV
jgi:hypothetical protein